MMLREKRREKKKNGKEQLAFSDLKVCVRTMPSIFIGYQCGSLRHTSKGPVWNEVREGLAGKKESWLSRKKGLRKTALTGSCQENVPLHGFSYSFTMLMGYKCLLLGLNWEVKENFCKSLQLMLSHSTTRKIVSWNWRDILPKRWKFQQIERG